MKKILIIMAVFLLFTGAYAGNYYEIMTENYPPFNYVKNGRARGIVSEVVAGVEKRIGWSNAVHLYSWNRAYGSIKTKPGKILFSMAKTDLRSPLFKWVGPIIKPKGYFYKNSNSKKAPADISDIKNNFTVGVRENSNVHLNFLKEGYRHIIPLENTEAYYRGLYYGRVDLIVSSPYNIPFRAEKYGLNADVFERTGVQAGQGKLYIAFSKGTPDNIISLWQGALDTIKKEGLLEKLIRKGLRDAEEDFHVKFNINEF